MPGDKFSVDPLASDALRILEAATAESAEPWTILVVDGAIRMLAHNDWPLAALRREHGAERAYRVSRAGDQVAVTAESATLRCEFRKSSPAAAARVLLGGWGGSAAR